MRKNTEAVDATIAYRTLKEVEYPAAISQSEIKLAVLEARRYCDAIELGLMQGPRKRLLEEPLYRQLFTAAFATVEICASAGLFDCGDDQLTYPELTKVMSAFQTMLAGKTVVDALSAVTAAARANGVKESARLPRTAWEFAEAA